MINPAAADRTARPLRKVLILGPRGVADLIAKELEHQGLQPEVHDARLPVVADPNALDHLRGVFGNFAERAAAAGAQGNCIHPGVSVWAERQEIGTIAQEFGLSVICPPARVLSLFGNKLNLMTEAEKLGIPHIVLSFDPMHTAREIEKLIERPGLGQPFPFVLKAVKGGGSRGLLVIHGTEDLERRLPLWLEQVRQNLGEVILFAERYLEGARHLTVPFARLHDGRVETFPITDSSLQCRFRKIIEFCPATGIDPAVEEEIREWATRLADACGYVGVGTCEFLVDSNRAWLIEGSARLNTSFHLWENVAGTSAVAWQMAAFEGAGLKSGPVVRPRKAGGAGIALRIYAEDSLLQLPQPGRVHEIGDKREWTFPGAAARLDLTIPADNVVSPQDYGLVAELWIGARDRKQALTIARGLIEEIWLAGSLQTNERFLSELLNHPWVREGIFHASFVDEEFLPSVRPPIDLIRLVASVAVSIPAFGDGPQMRWAVGDQWVKPDVSLVKWKSPPSAWMHDGRPGISGLLEVKDGSALRVCLYPLAEGKWQTRIGTWVLPVRRVLINQARKGARILSLIPGRVHSVLFREGATVPAHEPMVIIESLGTLVPHALPVEVKILRWKVRAEDEIQAGEELAEFETAPKN